jgi:SAM-dependent methyltransferase
MQQISSRTSIKHFPRSNVGRRLIVPPFPNAPIEDEMPDPFDPQTLRFYSNSAETYLGSRPDGTSRHLQSFLALLQPGACILELGCGAGRDAEAMLKAGFAVEATDGTPEIAEIASARLGRPVRVMRFDQLDAENAFDAVWANASLLHIPRDELAFVLKLISRALKPGGIHFANFKAGGTEGRDEKDRYYNYFDLHQLTELYNSAADWEILSTLAYTGGGGFEGKTGPWVSITVRKPG